MSTGSGRTTRPAVRGRKRAKPWTGEAVTIGPGSVVCLWCRDGDSNGEVPPHDCPDHGPGYVPPAYAKRMKIPKARIRDDRQRVVVALTYAETRTVLGLLEGCDDAPAPIKREALGVARRIRIADHRARNQQAAAAKAAR